MAPDLAELNTATAFLREGWHYTTAGQPWALVTRAGNARRVYVWRVEDPRPDSAQLRRLFRLTPMQARVTRMLMTRRTNAEMAEQLGLSIHTVRRHVEAVLMRTGATSRWDIEQVVYAAVAKAGKRTKKETQKPRALRAS